MKLLLFFGVVIFVFYLIFKAPDWSESNNKVKSSIGCTVMAVLIGGGLLFALFGTIKSCADTIKPQSDEYYDSPRK